jgi:hypothetical protein
VFALVALVGTLWLTRSPGPGLSPDSMSYLGAAESFARTGSLRVPFADWSDADSTAPLVHFPPGYPWLLGLPVALGLPPVQAARWVQALAGSATSAAVVLLAGVEAGTGAGVLAGVLLVATQPFVADHYIVLSEPLYLAFLVLALALQVRAADQPLAVGTAAAFALATRYVGLAVVVAGSLWMLLRPGPLRARLRAAVIAGVPGLLFLAPWKLWAGELREYGVKPGFGAALAEGWATLVDWLAPSLGGFGWRGAAALAVAAGVAVLLWRGARTARGGRLVRAALLVAACYAALLVATRFYADAGTPFDWRMLSPVMVLVTLGVATSLGAAWGGWGNPTRVAVGVCVLAWLVGSGRLVVQDAEALGDDGWGYAGAEYQKSDLTAWLRRDGARYRIFSNNPATVYALARRPSRMLPPGGDGTQVAQLAAVLVGAPSAVIWFAEPLDSTLGVDTIAAVAKLRPAGRFDLGAVWVTRDR